MLEKKTIRLQSLKKPKIIEYLSLSKEICTINVEQKSLLPKNQKLKNTKHIYINSYVNIKPIDAKIK